jgi:hypothetical protein
MASELLAALGPRVVGLGQVLDAALPRLRGEHVSDDPGIGPLARRKLELDSFPG